VSFKHESDWDWFAKAVAVVAILIALTFAIGAWLM